MPLWPIDWGCCPLTCTACTGGPLGASTRARIPVQGGLWRGEHPTVIQRGCSCCQGLAAQSPSSWLVHGIRIGYRHGNMHGEVLLRQCCRLHEDDKHKWIFTNKHTQNPRPWWWRVTGCHGIINRELPLRASFNKQTDLQNSRAHHTSKD